MRFVMTEISNTVIAYNVHVNGGVIGQVFLRNEYWHARRADAEKLTQGGPGFVLGHGYESRDEAATALMKELVSR